VTRHDWIPVAAEVLGLDRSVLTERAGACSFTALGGTSLRAAEYIARLRQDRGRVADIAALLGPLPLAEVAPGVPAEPQPAPAVQDGDDFGVCRSQEAMLLAEQLWGCEPSPFHLMFSAVISGNLDESRLRTVLTDLTRRHAALRTVFTSVPDTGALASRVLTAWDPTVIDQSLPPVPPEADPAEVVHNLLAPAAPRLLRPYDRPPIVFVLTHVGPMLTIMSIVAHHAIIDGWSIGLLWEQIAAGYGAPDHGEVAAPGMEHIFAAEQAALARNAAGARAAALEGGPAIVSLPSDTDRGEPRSLAGSRLPFTLSAAAHAGCAAVATAAGVTRNAVMLAAWALVIARRAGVDRLIIGMPVAGRTTAASRQVVGCGAKLLPVSCQIEANDTVLDHARTMAQRLYEALEYSDVPFEEIVTAAKASSGSSGSPLVQVAFGAHDELVPTTLNAADLTFRIREGHCGGAAFDATLYMQRWEPVPVLALEYATSVLTPADATELAASLDCTLAQMAGAPHGPLADVTTMSTRQHQQLITAGAGPEGDASSGLWDLIADAANRHPDAIAVRDTDAARTVTYRELIAAAEAQSAELAAAGVRDGDRVAIAVRRSIGEIVAILSILRLGAAYVGLDPMIPPAAAQVMLDQAGAMVVTGDPGRLAALGAAMTGRTAVRILGPGTAARYPVPLAAIPDPDRTAYVAFTSGSTGRPKGALIACRGVTRLAHNATYLRPGACARFARLAPLAFDASTLEIFAPLLAGGSLEIFPGSHVTPDALAEFLHERRITGLWLTAGLFRLVADYRPDAFRGVTQLLTGGDVVPPQQVARVLRACPGLRVTNGYGPTENTTFTAVFHMDDPAAAARTTLPIGRPIQGTGVLILDSAGRLVPPGGIGELFVYGDGVAQGYADMPAETAKAFGAFSPEVKHMLYRTGDIARWDGDWNLRFLGRRDRQLKIRGFRIELDSIAHVLRDHPAVRDATVVAADLRGGDRQILAAVTADSTSSALHGRLRAFAAERLPSYAVPALWAIVDELPLTPNGKLDIRKLTEIATGTVDDRVPAPPQTDEQLAAEVWQQVLGHRDFGVHDRFFDVGGDSLQLLRVHALLSRTLERGSVTVGDLYRHPTIAEITTLIKEATPP
jgi:amino acid adenylation domain-containing protein